MAWSCPEAQDKAITGDTAAVIGSLLQYQYHLNSNVWKKGKLSAKIH